MRARSGCSGASPQEQPLATTPGAAAILFEGATLIDGDTGRAVENAAFVVDGTRFGPVGRQGEVALPPGATRVDLTGKMVMPALVSAHVHVGLLDGNDFGPQVYTHDKIVEHLQRYAYYGSARCSAPAPTSVRCRSPSATSDPHMRLGC